jgi:hypothetical protein
VGAQWHHDSHSFYFQNLFQYITILPIWTITLLTAIGVYWTDIYELKILLHTVHSWKEICDFLLYSFVAVLVFYSFTLNSKSDWIIRAKKLMCSHSSLQNLSPRALLCRVHRKLQLTALQEVWQIFIFCVLYLQTVWNIWTGMYSTLPGYSHATNNYNI